MLKQRAQPSIPPIQMCDALSRNVRGWLEVQSAERKTEPNSGPGKAITYLLRRWRPVTMFLLRAQTSPVGIVGPTTAVSSQPLTLRLMSGSQQLVPDSWRQLYNPDRYTGTEWVTSFDLQLQPNADGSLTATARYPGRYKIAAVQGAQQYTTTVVVKPVRPLFKMKGLDFGGFTGLDRAYAANANRALGTDGQRDRGRGRSIPGSEYHTGDGLDCR